MLLIHNLTVEEINTALLSITKNMQNNNTKKDSNTDSKVDDIGTCVIYCGNDIDTTSTEEIEVYDGWLLCNHAEVSVSKYYSLYKKIGRKFGDGNGTTTFNLPDYMNKISNAVYIIKYK